MSKPKTHNVTKEDFIHIIANFVNQHEDDLKKGSSKFSLNPTCIKLLNAVLKGEQKVFTLGHNELLDLKFFITQLTSLVIQSNQQGVVEKHRAIDLSLFESLRELEIHDCKPGLITNFSQLSKALERISIYNSIVALNELLTIEGDDASQRPWGKLIFLGCRGNFIPKIDESILVSVQEIDLSNNIISKIENMGALRTLIDLDLSHNAITSISDLDPLTNMEQLDMSFNRLTRIENLQNCTNLRHLYLCGNNIATTARVNESIGCMKTLVLRKNRLTSVAGIDKLYALETLDLAENLLQNMEDVKALGNLPCIQELWLDGNPLCVIEEYRVTVLSWYEEEIVLDGRAASPEEKRQLLGMKQPQIIPPAQEAARVHGDEADIVPLGSPVKKKKKKGTKERKKREARIESLRTHIEAPAQEQVDETDEFKAKITSLRAEAGREWLAVLNELQGDDSFSQKHKYSEDLYGRSPISFGIIPASYVQDGNAPTTATPPQLSLEELQASIERAIKAKDVPTTTAHHTAVSTTLSTRMAARASSDTPASPALANTSVPGVPVATAAPPKSVTPTEAPITPGAPTTTPAPATTTPTAPPTIPTALPTTPPIKPVATPIITPTPTPTPITAPATATLPTLAPVPALPSAPRPTAEGKATTPSTTPSTTPRADASAASKVESKTSVKPESNKTASTPDDTKMNSSGSNSYNKFDSAPTSVEPPKLPSRETDTNKAGNRNSIDIKSIDASKPTKEEEDEKQSAILKLKQKLDTETADIYYVERWSDTGIAEPRFLQVIDNMVSG